MIDINKIVNVDFEIKSESATIGNYDTTVYIVNSNVAFLDSYQSTNTFLASAYSDVVKLTNDVALLYNARMYFNNGGAKLLICKAAGNGFEEDIKACRQLSDSFIYVCVANDVLGTGDYENITEIAQYIEELKAPYTLRLLITTHSTTTYDALKDFSVGIKYSTAQLSTGVATTAYVDAALLIGAYFSKVELDGSNTIEDYCYTKEYITDNSGNVLFEDVDNDLYDTLIEKNYNFIGQIGTEIINFGGNLANGISLHVDFGTICVENDVTYSALRTITGKIYLTNAGMSALIGAINDKIQRYKRNGFLNLGATYSGNTLTTVYNDRTFTVIKGGTLLPQGYYVFYVPVTYISAGDKALKKFPPIYIVMETQGGARVVEINGEVR